MPAIRPLLFLVVVAGFLAACGGDGDPEIAEPSVINAPDPGDVDPETAGSIAQFRLPALIVAPGSAIAVDNLDNESHTYSSSDFLFDTGTLDRGDTGNFDAPLESGTYAVFCSIHPSMTAELIVQ